MLHTHEPLHGKWKLKMFIKQVRQRVTPRKRNHDEWKLFYKEARRYFTRSRFMQIFPSLWSSLWWQESFSPGQEGWWPRLPAVFVTCHLVQNIPYVQVIYSGLACFSTLEGHVFTATVCHRIVSWPLKSPMLTFHASLSPAPDNFTPLGISMALTFVSFHAVGLTWF